MMLAHHEATIAMGLAAITLAMSEGARKLLAIVITIVVMVALTWWEGDDA